MSQAKVAHGRLAGRLNFDVVARKIIKHGSCSLVTKGREQTQTGRDYLDRSNKKNVNVRFLLQNVLKHFPLRALMNTSLTSLLRLGRTLLFYQCPNNN